MLFSAVQLLLASQFQPDSADVLLPYPALLPLAAPADVLLLMLVLLLAVPVLLVFLPAVPVGALLLRTALFLAVPADVLSLAPVLPLAVPVLLPFLHLPVSACHLALPFLSCCSEDGTPE